MLWLALNFVDFSLLRLGAHLYDLLMDGLSMDNGLVIDKLNLTGQNLGQVFNFRQGCTFVCYAITLITKQSCLKLKTWPKQLLGSLLLAFALPG